MQTIEQARAAYANQAVQAVKADPAVAGHYRSYARQFGAMIHTNGLGQALAFALSKGSNPKDAKDKAWGKLYGHFSDWLTGQGNVAGTSPEPLGAATDALRGVTQGNVATYMLATAEAMALAVWLKRLAEALIETKAKTEAKAEGQAAP